MVDGDGTAGAGNLSQNQSGGATPPAWVAQLSDDLKGNEVFTGYKTVSDLAKTHVDVLGKNKDLEGKLSSAIIPPGEGASQEEVNAFYTKLGRPASMDEYVIPENVPPGLLSDSGKTWYRKQMFDLGLSKDKAASLLDSYLKAQEAAAEEIKNTGLQELRKDPDWSTDDKYKANMATMARAVDWLAMPEFNSLMDMSGMGNNPVIVKAFYKIGLALSEDVLVKGQPKTGGESKGLHYPSMEKEGGS